MISFQELCLQYGENNLTQTMLIDFIKQREKYLQLCVECKENEISLLKKKDELKQKAYDDHVQKLNSDYDYLYKKWKEFSKCLNMGPEKFISMLDDLKEKIKSKANEITYLREQLKTSELDAKRYKNDGIQDRVKLQEVMVQLESMTKMRDNWKSYCEDAQKCFQTERDKRWELEEEVKQLKNQVQSLIDALYEVCPKQKIDVSSYVKSKKELDELVEKRLSVFEEPTLMVIGNDVEGYHNIYVNFLDELLFIDSVKNNLSELKGSLMIVEFPTKYAIKNTENGNYLYTIDKSTKCIEKLTHIEFVESGSTDTDCCKCPYSCRDCKKRYTKIYFTVGAERILIDTVPFYVNYWHYSIGEDSIKTRYVIARKDPMQKDLHNYAISKETLKVKVID